MLKLNHCSLAAVLIAVASTVYGQTTTDPLVDFLNRLYNSNNLCSQQICYNGGYCTIGADSFPRCTCQPAFTGTQCEFKNNDDLCLGYCENGGTCDYLDGLHLAICSCPVGYTGNRCQKRDNDWFNWGFGKTSKPDDIDVVLPDIDLNDDKYISNNTEEYMDESGGLWIVITSVIAAVILSMMYAMLHYIVRQRRRRRAILIRTIQVEAQNAGLHHAPGTYITPGVTRPRNFLTIMPQYPRSVPCESARIEQPAIPRQFESDSAPLVSSEELPAMSNDFMYEPSQRLSSGVCIPTGAPPPYAQVAPEEGGHSMNEAPPPYSGPE